MTEKNLQQEIADLKMKIRNLQKNRLGLGFEDKPEDVVTQCENNVPVLKELNDDKEKEFVDIIKQSIWAKGTSDYYKLGEKMERK